ECAGRRYVCRRLGHGDSIAVAHRPVFSQSGRGAVWRRLRFARLPGTRTCSATCLAHPRAIARCHRDRAVHSRSGAFDGDVYRVHSWRRAGGCGRDRGNLSALVFLCRPAGASLVPASAIAMGFGVSGLGERVHGCPDGGSDIPPGCRLRTDLAIVVDRDCFVAGFVAVEDQSGMGGTWWRCWRVGIGQFCMTHISWRNPMALRKLVGAVLFLSFTVLASAGDRKYIVNPRPGDTKALPFSDAVLVGNTLYIAGHIGLDPKTAQAPADAELEAHLVMDGITKT